MRFQCAAMGMLLLLASAYACLTCCVEPLPDGTCCCVRPPKDGCPPLPPSCPPPPPNASSVTLGWNPVLMKYKPTNAAEPEASSGPRAPSRLRMEYMKNPQGVDVEYKPRLTWSLGHTARGQAQTAYRIAASELTGSGWNAAYDSGKVISNRSQNVHLAASLTPDTLYTYTVQYWDKDGAISDWAANATFSTAAASWGSASWIGQAHGGSFIARQTFETASKEVVRATAYVVGLGYYKLYVDGQKVSTHELGAFTTYEKRVYYDTYDITKAMADSTSSSTHAVGLHVGTGWYSQKSVHVGQETMLLHISILFSDGTRGTVISNSDWKVAESPIKTVDIYAGETYNASKEYPGWEESTYSPASSDWVAATVMPPPRNTTVLSSHAILPPIRIGQTYTPCDMWESSAGVYVFDFCQNMAGFTTLVVPEGLATDAGQMIQIQHAELLNGPKPAPIHNHYNDAPEINTYFARGNGEAIEYTTQFTYAGFRYVSLKGYPGTPNVQTLTAHFIHTDYEMTGGISFSDPLLTSVQRITRTAAMSNYQSIPTDCPQRERRGWLGDAQLSCETNMHNFDMGAPYTSFIQQIADSQDDSGAVQDCVPYYGHGFDPGDPAWGAAFPLIADWVGKYYHDDQIFATHYTSIVAHTDQLIATANADNSTGLLTYGGWGDWCPPSGCEDCWNHQSRTERLKSQNSVLVSSFYYILELRIVAKYAQILGKQDDFTKYSKLATDAAAAYNKRFYDPVGKTYTEKRTCGEYLSPQTMISLSAALGVIPSVDYDAVIDNLVADVAAHGWHLNVGIVGIKYLLSTLSAGGRGDVALMVAQAKTPPSYIYMVDQGATTLWETWEGTTYEPSGSRNHIMFGSNSDWYYKYLAGITMAEGTRGWQQLKLKPEVWNKHRQVSICANLSSTSASIVTPRGKVAASWECLPQPGTDGTCGLFQELDTMILNCTYNGTIKSVDLALYGDPTGTCGGGFKTGSCNSKASKSVVEQACLGKNSCSLPVVTKTFGGDPCGGTFKELAVQVTCAGGVTPSQTPVFSYSVSVPVGSIADVVLAQFGSTSASVDEAHGSVWAGDKHIPGVNGVNGAAVDDDGNIALQIGSGDYTFTVSV